MSDTGIMGTIQLAATLVFALPVGLLGLQFLLDGRMLSGAGFVVVAVLMVALEEYLTTPGDVSTSMAEKAVGMVAKEPGDED